MTHKGTMSDLKQVKVDNWGIYFLQRLKHFFNRTDFCDLTLQFQDNAQLKVHRLVLSACTEYFELLERTCEMYEDCLVMPDDLQADVVVPIVNFMYTGQLEFKIDLLERLYQTSLIMNMPVLSKLLDAQRNQVLKPLKVTNNYSVKSYKKSERKKYATPSSSNINSNKRSYTNSFETIQLISEKKSSIQSDSNRGFNNSYESQMASPASSSFAKRPRWAAEPRPTRFEVPEEFVGEMFGESFSNISYESKPLMIHPETRKHYSAKSSGIFNDASSSKSFRKGVTSLDIVECKKINKDGNEKDDNIFSDNITELSNESNLFGASFVNKVHEDSNKLFDNILDNSEKPKLTIESKEKPNIDHAKIISEVLKKYPHLVKSNKNIKLKIVNAQSEIKKSKPVAIKQENDDDVKVRNTRESHTFETDVLNSMEAAKLIALGAENIRGPWICLICGTPGKALNFTSYYKFRRHLVEVHHEKPIANICEYCGLKSHKRNYLLHHMYTKHGIEPPPQFHFPKCNLCSYVALTEGFMVKHKLSHSDTGNFKCNVCTNTFKTSAALLLHIQSSGHKYSAERKTNLQCIYCLKVFLRDSNLYAHLKTQHKFEAKSDGIIDDSDDEDKPEVSKTLRMKSDPVKKENYKYDLPTNIEIEYEEDEQYQIQEQPDGDIHIISKPNVNSNSKQKILNDGFGPMTSKTNEKPKPAVMPIEYLEDNSDSLMDQEFVVIGDETYVMKNNQLIKQKHVPRMEEFILPRVKSEEDNLTSQSINYSNIRYEQPVESIKTISKTPANVNLPSNMNLPIEIVVSNEEEYQALMNNSHSIIFENNDETKLTVLKTSNNTASNNPSIDLDNTQPSEMMIIPDDYALSVTEPVPTGNSNIVVVYSHTVDESKPYALLSSQAINAQLVSSAPLPQSYGTFTTAAPIMTTQILTASSECWQKNTELNVANIVDEASEGQVITVIEQTNEVMNDEQIAEELPEIEISNKINEVAVNEIKDVQSQEEVIQQVHDKEDSVADMSQMSHDLNEMEVDQSENIPIADFTEDNNVNPNVEITNLATADASINITVADEQIKNGNTEEAITESELIILSNTGHIDNVSGQQEQVDSPKINISQEKENESNCDYEIKDVNKETPKAIKNLALEWSEDEEETTVAENNEKSDNAEIEESIENIQNEIEKDQPSDPDAEIQNVEIITAQEEATAISKIPPVKITSLLNDWDENDSQEDSAKENESTIENDDNVLPKDVEDNDAIDGNNDVNPETDTINKDDNIKKLVSDWDEEEDDKEVDSSIAEIKESQS